MMEAWVKEFREAAAHLIVGEIEFSGSTYQIEVQDPDENETYWPFLHFDSKNTLHDAFCSCPFEKGSCKHLAAAYLKIWGHYDEPLHQRFKYSFWNYFCQLMAEQLGYENPLHLAPDGSYSAQNNGNFTIQTKTLSGAEKLTLTLERKERATPENSLLFSDLSQEEIARWKEGRTTPYLRYLLSFWFGLAKWMMLESESGEVVFEEDREGLPTHLTLRFPDLEISAEILKGELPSLIPSLESVNSSLKVLHLDEETIKNISFDPESHVFEIEHYKIDTDKISSKTRPLNGWNYLPNQGFFSSDAGSLLNQSIISKEDAPQFLERFHNIIGRFIPIHEKKLPLSYSLYFDSQWNWHFEAYLFNKGDLKDASCTGQWLFVKDEGFYPLAKPLFSEFYATVEASQVSSFVHQHRIWLNGIEGFQTHLASIESHLSYRVTEEEGLRFDAKIPLELRDVKDFGDWVFYKGLGFFSKKHARLGTEIQPGLSIPSYHISHFIKNNREELELIPNFFTQNSPLESRSLQLMRVYNHSVKIKPTATFKSPYTSSQVLIFGDFAYIIGEGFSELSPEMRIPEDFLESVTYSQSELPAFFEEELPHLLKYFSYIEPTLQIPHRFHFTVENLQRENGGELKGQFFCQTELGKVSLTEILDAFAHRRRFCFSDAGRLDLNQEMFQWLKQYKNNYDPETQTLEISTLELIRLDAAFGLDLPTDSSPKAQQTRNLLKELREFLPPEMPNIEGLKSHLRLYQQTGLSWLWFLYRNGLSGLLCDDMGLGKTHQAMALLAAMNNHSQKRQFLIVCPTSVIYHWQDKLAVFLPHLNVQTFHGLRRTLNDTAEGIILTSYGILRSERERLSKVRFEAAIFDEVQVAKNPRSRVHEAIKMMRSRMRVGLTGTPIENNLRELKALFDLVLPGYMPTEAKFRELFVLPIERDRNPEKKALLVQMIRPFVLRRKKTDVLQELPEKSEDKSYCDLSIEQSELYKKILQPARDHLLGKLKDEKSSINYLHIFSLLSQLKQACDHPALIYKEPKDYKSYASGKWDLFVELLDEAMESDQKVVVFSQYLHMLDIMSYYLQEKKIGFAQIRGDTLDRREEMRRFQEEQECKVFIGSLQAAGLGIDLTAASVVIMYDRWWNAARENQAIDRVHRIGQKRGVQVYKLITKNTIEEKIDEMITRKGELLEEVVTTDDQALFKKFTREELIDLLTFHDDIVD